MPRSTYPTSVRLNQEQRDALKKITEATGESEHALIIRILDTFLGTGSADIPVRIRVSVDDGDIKDAVEAALPNADSGNDG